MIFIPRNIWEKQLIHSVAKILVAVCKTRCFKPKLVLHAGRENNIGLLMLVLDFVVNSRLNKLILQYLKTGHCK